jgi:hypothetical protein
MLPEICELEQRILLKFSNIEISENIKKRHFPERFPTGEIETKKVPERFCRTSTTRGNEKKSYFAFCHYYSISSI